MKILSKRPENILGNQTLLLFTNGKLTNRHSISLEETTKHNRHMVAGLHKLSDAVEYLNNLRVFVKSRQQYPLDELFDEFEDEFAQMIEQSLTKKITHDGQTIHHALVDL